MKRRKLTSAPQVLDDGTVVVEKEKLLAVLDVVAPCLVLQPFVPILGHICFNGKTATGFNDIQGIQVPFNLPMHCSMPGETLRRLVSTMSGTKPLELTEYDVKERDASQDKIAGRHVRIKSGRTVMDIAALTEDKYVYAPPNVKEDPVQVEVTLHPGVLKALKQCVPFVGTNPMHPAQMGVTLLVDDGFAAFYATDNTIVVRAELSKNMRKMVVRENPKKAFVCILPTDFCQHLLTLSEGKMSEHPVLEIGGAYATATFSSGTVYFTKLVADDAPYDFEQVLDQALGDVSLRDAVEITDTFREAVERAVLLFGTSLEKILDVESDNGVSMLRSAAMDGNAIRDRVRLEGLPDTTFRIDAGAFKTVLNAVDNVYYLSSAILGYSPRFVVLLEHMSRHGQAAESETDEGR